MRISVNLFVKKLKTSRATVCRMRQALGYVPAVQGRIGRGGREEYSIKDACALGEMLCLREHGYPADLLRHLMTVHYNDLTDEEAIGIMTGELTWQQEEMIAKAEAEGGIKNVLYPPKILKAVEKRMRPLCNYVKKMLSPK